MKAETAHTGLRSSNTHKYYLLHCANMLKMYTLFIQIHVTAVVKSIWEGS